MLLLQIQSRWREAELDNHRRICIKVARNGGIAYTNHKGQSFEARKVQMLNDHKHGDSSSFHCCKVSETDRQSFFNSYWAFGTNENGKKGFLLQYTECEPAKRSRIGKIENSGKKQSLIFFMIQDGMKVRVCKEFFLKTFNISQKPVINAYKRCDSTKAIHNDSQQGRHEPHHKIKHTYRESVICHINSFPRIPSHYCRRSSKREYLDPNLSVKKMFELFQEWDDKPIGCKIAFPTYQRIFATEFNLGFHQPRKDQCATCAAYNNKKSSGQCDEKFEQDQTDHISRKEASSQKMKNLIFEAKENSDVVVATTDLQSVLQIPQSKESQFYYKRKLCMYNSTFFIENSGEAYCYVWTELDSKRGANEIGTCSKKFIERQVQKGKKKIVIWSDNCGGQNRNKFLMAMYHKLVQETANLESIQHCYLESGHTQMSVDSTHSLIERASKYTSIFSPNEWCNIMPSARSKRPYNIVRLSHEDFVDLKRVQENEFNAMDKSIDGNKINWLKIRSIKFERENNSEMYFSYDHGSDIYQAAKILPQRKKDRPSAQIPWPKLHDSMLKIKKAKKDDLVSLCQNGLIPVEYHAWFRSLETFNDENEAQSDDSTEE